MYLNYFLLKEKGQKNVLKVFYMLAAHYTCWWLTSLISSLSIKVALLAANVKSSHPSVMIW